LFCPDANVTRGQMAAFLVRALGYTAGGGDDLFTDDDDSVFEADIDRLGTAGVTKGCNPPDNTEFCPGAAVTRDQMASFLARALGLAAIDVSTPTTTTTTVPGTDYPRSGDSWYFDECDNDTGTCAYSASDGEGPAKLVVTKPLLPTATIWDYSDPFFPTSREVAMWKFEWFDPAGTQIPGGRSEQTLYDSGTGGIRTVVNSMFVTGRVPGDYRVTMCRKVSQYSSECAGDTLLEVYFQVTP
jgi:hypothetical protein